ncbi:hypothetical protein [Labrys neptuniae]
MTMTKHPDRPSWKRRWLLIRLALIWCAVFGSYIIVWGPDDRVRETAFLGIITLAGSISLGYLGFATWDDRNLMHHIRAAPRGPPLIPATEPDTDPEQPEEGN